MEQLKSLFLKFSENKVPVIALIDTDTKDLIILRSAET